MISAKITAKLVSAAEGRHNEVKLRLQAKQAAGFFSESHDQCKGVSAMKYDGGWVFISHSHLDIELVRRIRNYLEERGFEPLLFYLKCLNDDDEIEDLIRREINEREWFIYIDSKNSRNSRWVRSERDYISSLPGKKVFTIDLSQDIMPQLKHITSQLQVFISYSADDSKLAGLIAERLAARDMLVFMDKREQTESTIEASSRSGFVVLLVTENTMDSQSVKEEISLAVKMGGRIVPVYVNDAVLSDELLPLIGDIQGARVSSSPAEEELQALVDSIMHHVEYYKADFTTQIGFQSAVRIVYPPIGRIDDYAFWDCSRLEEVTIPPAVQFISEKAFRRDQDVLIKCKKGSYAEKYCIAHGLRYEIIE